MFEERTGNPVWSDAVPSACAGGASVGSGGGPVALAAAAGVIAVPYRDHLVMYGVTPSVDGGSDAASDATGD